MAPPFVFYCKLNSSNFAADFAALTCFFPHLYTVMYIEKKE